MRYSKEEKYKGDMNKIFTRLALHEGIGHPDLGLGHTDSDRRQGKFPERYYGLDLIRNIMDSGGTMDWNDPSSFLFLPVDLGIIQRNIPSSTQSININGVQTTICRDNTSPIDNFTSRL